MFRMLDGGPAQPGGFSRREFLRVGSLALGGLTLPGLLAGRAKAAGSMVKDRAVVLLSSSRVVRRTSSSSIPR